MSATRKTVLIAALFGTFLLSVQTAAQARDLGMGARSFYHGMRGFAVNPGFARAKHFDGRLLSADVLRSEATTKPSSAFMVKVETTTMSAKKRVHGHVPLQVKGGSAAGARRGQVGDAEALAAERRIAGAGGPVGAPCLHAPAADLCNTGQLLAASSAAELIRHAIC